MNLEASEQRGGPAAGAAPVDTGHATAAPRRTFAIISHPDAGKTTLTEKLLAASGAIQLAGHVKARGNRRRTRSDWMEIEQKRGISVASSVMTFEHQGIIFNLLDTPGHADFSEDTYRILTAVDAAIMVIDAAKGIEAQTRKLFEVCRLRDIPIFTFVNKIDREGLTPLELLDEISQTLAIDVTPVSWPFGTGVDLRFCLNLDNGLTTLPDGSPGAATGLEAIRADNKTASDPVLGAALEGLELAQLSLPAFDIGGFRAGHLTPVLFGSALKDIGVRDLLAALVKWAPGPMEQPAEPEPVLPSAEDVTGFVFKVQANMDPNHRDRVAFVRICSGTFKRGMKLKNTRSGRDLTVANPMFFMAQQRELAEEARPGDIVGIPNHGTLNVGDTLTQGRQLQVTGIPNFAPEAIKRVRLSDPIKAKQLAKALRDLADEGVAQVFRPMVGADWLVGVVGPLQFDVLVTRMTSEFGIPVSLEPVNRQVTRWVSADDKKRMDAFLAANRSSLAEDRNGRFVVFCESNFWLDRLQRDWPEIAFSDVAERAGSAA